MRVGAAFRAVRVRRRWRQEDVARRAGVSRGFVSLVERGHLDRVSLSTLRRLGAALDIRVDLYARWRGGELARMVNQRHSALHESVARAFGQWPAWQLTPEVSFSVYGERGVIDILAFHPASGALLVIELKTDIVDVNDLVGSLDRKTRLASGIAADRGWRASNVSCWVIVAADKTNQRRIEAHRSMLRAAYPDDGRTMRAWLREPSRTVRGLSMWTTATGGGTSPTRSHRVRVGLASGVRR